MEPDILNDLDKRLLELENKAKSSLEQITSLVNEVAEARTSLYKVRKYVADYSRIIEDNKQQFYEHLDKLPQGVRNNAKSNMLLMFEAMLTSRVADTMYNIDDITLQRTVSLLQKFIECRNNTNQ